MANTVIQRTIVGGASEKTVYRIIRLVSDGTEETALVIYDNSTLVADTAKGSIMQIWISGSGSGNVGIVEPLIRLEWDQTVNSPILSANPAGDMHFDFRDFGGITNPNAAGATGDIVLTTLGLEATDEFTIILHIRQI